MAIVDHSNMEKTDFVSQECELVPEAFDVLCIRCGWEGCASDGDPWRLILWHANTLARSRSYRIGTWSGDSSERV